MMQTMTPPPSFRGAIAPLSSEIDALWRNARASGEQLFIARMTNTGEALIVTSERTIIFKDGAHNETAAPRGRTFPLSIITDVTLQRGLRTTILAIRAAETVGAWTGFRPSWCSFAVTCTDDTFAREAAGYIRMLIERLGQQQLAQIATAPLVPIATPPGIIARSGERFYNARAAALFEEQTYRTYGGGSSGVSFRIMRGVYYRVGGNRGKSQTHKEIGQTDTGTLAVSDQRILFVGPRRTLDIPLTRLASVTPFTDGVRLNLASGQVVQFQTGESLSAIVIQRLAAHP